MRKHLIWLSIIASFGVVIHYATVKEDEQVIIDSHPAAMINNDSVERAVFNHGQIIFDDTMRIGALDDKMVNRAYKVGPIRVYLDGVLIDTIWENNSKKPSTLPPLIPHTSESIKYILGDDLPMPRRLQRKAVNAYKNISTPPFVPFDLTDKRHVEELLMPCDTECDGRYIRLVEEWLMSGADSCVYIFEQDTVYAKTGGLESKKGYQWHSQ